MMVANQVTSLLMEERIETTVPKAKETRRLAEKIITLAKKGTLHHRRRAIALLKQNTRTKHLIAYTDGKPVPAKQLAVRKAFDDLAARYADRPGGYTRIVKLGTRRGDAAEMCFLELVEADFTPKAKTSKPAKTVAEAVEAPVEEPAAELEETVDATEATAEVAEEVAEAPVEEAAPAEEAVEEAEAPAEEPVAEAPVEEAAPAEDAAEEAAEEPAAEAAPEAAEVQAEAPAEEAPAAEAEAPAEEASAEEPAAEEAAEGEEEKQSE
jgi:large subunit ribosomal protein L17